ncbi:MAG: L-lactate dehydrogenase (quinone) large subunit LdhH [Pseudomonadota bacterium]
MQQAKDLKGYRREIEKSLANQFQRQAMDKFAVDYRAGRKKAFSGMDVDNIIEAVAHAKDKAVAEMEDLLAEFKRNAAKSGIMVHEAHTAREANDIIAQIARDNQVQKIIKSKSMTAEETLLNHHLEGLGLEVTETDLGEWIVQLRHEGPSHMVMPAIHLSRYQVAELFGDVTGIQQESDIERLVKVARRELRHKFIEADMGISGANFAIADSGTIGIVSNEGNARLVTTLPRIHVALVGMEKIIPTLKDALQILRILPRNATGQAITSYVTWITGANECASASDKKKQMHIVFLDNGRRALSADPVFSQVLRCVRCGACANVCPVYRMVGGHQYGHIYIGAIGLIITYFFHGREKARNLVQNCINCGACKDVCAVGIDLPYLIKEVHARVQDEEGHPIKSLLLAKVLKNRKLFHTLLRSAQIAQKPMTGGTPYLRHLPQIFAKEHNFRALPAIAETPFRDRWAKIKPRVKAPRFRVALFSGCVQDFVYPEQLEAAIQLLADQDVAVEFPMGQTCCGLPVAMMAEKEAARDVAIQNLKAFNQYHYDYIITLCASCASHLKHAYPRLITTETNLTIPATTVTDFAAKVVPFSVFMDTHGVMAPGRKISDKKVTYHAPCHLCRGLGVIDAPHRLIQKTGFDFVQAEEEQTCCGFGGTYSSKFPEISAQILKKKLDDFSKTGAEILVTECPGCVMQLRGGAQKRHDTFEVLHIAEMMARNK